MRFGKRHWFKWQRRAGLVVANSLHSLLPLLFTPLLSWLVVRQSSLALWGAFVGVLLAVQLGAHLVGWGNHDYLLRQFSRHPAQLGAVWQSSLGSRLVLVLPLAGVAWLLYGQMAGWVWLWGLLLVLHQSWAVIITYRRDFLFAAAVEWGGLMATAVAILANRYQLTLSLLIQLFTAVTAIKTVLLTVRHWPIIRGKLGHFQASYFSAALPFFLLGLSGMVNSRLDLYFVYAWLSPEQMGSYQIFTSFLLHIQALAAFILTPFLKGLFRLQGEALANVSGRLLGLGCLIVPLAMGALFFLLRALYGLSLPPLYFLFGGLAALPIFYFLPIIYGLYGAGRETAVLKANLAGIGIALILHLLLLPRWGGLGAVAVTAVTNWSICLIYWQLGQPNLIDKA